MDNNLLNKNTKMKFISGPEKLEQPIFSYYTTTFKPVESIVYGADSKITNNANINTNSQYTRNYTAVDVNKNTTSDFDKTFFPGFLDKGDPNLYSSNIGIENELKIPDYQKNNNINCCQNDDRTFTQVHDRRRNLNYDRHINHGSMINRGFGNIDEFSKLKIGTFTRDTQQTIRDTEYDRFHFTFQNYQNEVYGSNPNPTDTRYLNKRFNHI